MKYLHVQLRQGGFDARREVRTRVVVNDRMQRGYVYCRTEPPGRDFAPAFRPELTPKQRSRQIGRASCRERGEISVVAGSLKKKKARHNTQKRWWVSVFSFPVLSPPGPTPPVGTSRPRFVPS